MINPYKIITDREFPLVFFTIFTKNGPLYMIFDKRNGKYLFERMRNISG